MASRWTPQIIHLFVNTCFKSWWVFVVHLGHGGTSILLHWVIAEFIVFEYELVKSSTWNMAVGVEYIDICIDCMIIISEVFMFFTFKFHSSLVIISSTHLQARLQKGANLLYQTWRREYEQNQLSWFQGLLTETFNQNVVNRVCWLINKWQNYMR